MIFVTVGTHEDPFDRLVRAAEALAAREEVVLQKGTSTVPTPQCRASASLSPEAMADAFSRARIVVGHGGPSTLLEAGAHGHVPILVPRSARFGEHVDDHQVAFARRIADRVHVVFDPEDLVDEVGRHAERVAGWPPFGPDPERSRAFAEDLGRICTRLVHERPPRRDLRDRFRALRLWMSAR